MMLVNDVLASFRKHANSKTTLYSKRFRYESKKSYFKNGGHILSPYYFETFIKPFLLLFIYNPLITKLFFRNVKKPHLMF